MATKKTETKKTEVKKAEAKDTILTPKRTVKFFIVNVVVCSIIGMIIWPLLDIIFCGIFGHTFEYSVSDHIIQPVIAMVIVTIIEFVGWNFWHKKR